MATELTHRNPARFGGLFLDKRMLTIIANILRAIGLTWLANKISPPVSAPDIAGGNGDRK